MHSVLPFPCVLRPSCAARLCGAKRLSRTAPGRVQDARLQLGLRMRAQSCRCRFKRRTNSFSAWCLKSNEGVMAWLGEQPLRTHLLLPAAQLNQFILQPPAFNCKTADAGLRRNYFTVQRSSDTPDSVSTSGTHLALPQFTTGRLGKCRVRLPHTDGLHIHAGGCIHSFIHSCTHHV